MEEPSTGITAVALATAAKAGDGHAWDVLIGRYGGMVKAVVTAFRLSEADAADVVQNAWLHAVEQVGDLREPERFGGWLRTIARRECLTLWAQRRRELLDGRLAENAVEPSPSPEALVLVRESAEAVRAAVAALTRRRRILVETLFYQPTPDYELVARTAGMPVGSIGPSRARAMRVLRVRLERAGFGSAAMAE